MGMPAVDILNVVWPSATSSVATCCILWKINGFMCGLQEAEKEAEVAKQKKAEKAEKKKQAKNKNKLQQAKPATQNTQPAQTEVRPYARSRPIGQASKQDTSADQSETRAPTADLPSRNDGSSPAVYVRGQKRKVSKRFGCHVALALV